MAGSPCLAAIRQATRQFNRRFLRMCAHYLVEAMACTASGGPGERAGRDATAFFSSKHPELCASQLLFHLISRPYERTAIITTTNLAFDQWPSVIGDAKMTWSPSCSQDARLVVFVPIHEPAPFSAVNSCQKNQNTSEVRPRLHSELLQSWINSWPRLNRIAFAFLSRRSCEDICRS